MTGRADQDLLVLHRDHDVGRFPRTRKPRDPILDDIDGPEKTLAPDVTDHFGMFSLMEFIIVISIKLNDLSCIKLVGNRLA